MPAVALSRVGARVIESGPGGGDLAADARQRLEALPDPRSPQGRIYPLACLIAIAVCAFTAAGNDRSTAIGQWIKRAGQADLARLRAVWDPLTGPYRAPDEKTIRMVLDRLDPRVLTRALLGPRPRSCQRSGRPPSANGAASQQRVGPVRPGREERRQRRRGGGRCWASEALMLTTHSRAGCAWPVAKAADAPRAESRWRLAEFSPRRSSPPVGCGNRGRDLQARPGRGSPLRVSPLRCAIDSEALRSPISRPLA